MRTHNPLPGVPQYLPLAQRFAVLIRSRYPCVASGDMNCRITTLDQSPVEVLRSLEACAHILRIRFEVQQVTPQYIYITLERRTV